MGHPQGPDREGAGGNRQGLDLQANQGRIRRVVEKAYRITLSQSPQALGRCKPQDQ